MASSAEEPECAICCEPVNEVTSLPCSCKVSYCMRCWDQALARSFQSSGQARCPTCRACVRVDFDADNGRLKFSRGEEDFSFDRERRAGLEERVRLEEARNQAIERLAEQALPMQVRQLQAYAEKHPEMQEIFQAPEDCAQRLSVSQLKERLGAAGVDPSDCLEKDELVKKLQENFADGHCLASFLVFDKFGGPSCVCGKALERVTGKQRAKRYATSRMPHISPESPIIERWLQQMVRRGSCGIICDMCESKEISMTTGVWTCQAGDATILHAMAYDVCDDCFVKHVYQPGADVVTRD